MISFKSGRRIDFLNAFIDNVTLEEVRDVIYEHVTNRVPGYMVSLNTDICIVLDRNSRFMEAYKGASLALMDSQPLLKLARAQGIEIKEKISGSDLMAPVCAWAAKQGWSVFFLGGKEGVPDEAARRLSKSNPGLMVAGVMSPPLGFENDEDETRIVVETVREARPDILFMCCGAPKSEVFLHEHIRELDVPFSLAVGAAIDFAAGNIKRAPTWMQRAGLEWLYRFLLEPNRLFKRYFIDSWHILSILKRYGVSGVN